MRPIVRVASYCTILGIDLRLSQDWISLLASGIL